MSKGSLFWANARGKLGEAVFYRAGGEQRNRTYVKNIKNPKTVAQMTNRLRMLNPISIFAGMKNLLRTSFTNKTSAQSSFNVFMKENKTSQKYFITQDMKNQAMCVPYGAKISNGSLGLDLMPVPRNIGNDGSGTPSGYAYALECLFNAKNYTFNGAEVVGSQRYRVPESDLVKAIRAMSLVTLPTKFTLVFVQGVPSEYEAADGEIFSPWKMAYGVLSVDGDTYDWKVYGCAENSLSPNIYVVKSSGAFAASDTTGDYAAVGLALTALDLLSRPMGVILSFVEDGVLKVSNSTMASNTRSVGAESVRGIAREFVEGAAVYKLAMTEYGYSTGSILNGETLAEAPTEDSEDESEGDTGGEPEGEEP